MTLNIEGLCCTPVAKYKKSQIFITATLSMLVLTNHNSPCLVLFYILHHAA